MHSDTNLGYLLHHLTSILDYQSDCALQNKLGIGFSQFKILLALQWQSGLQQKQIARWLGQTEASVSRQVKMLLDKNILSTEPSVQNRRQHIIVLSKKGELLADRATRILNDRFVPLIAGLTERQQKELIHSLKTMHEKVCYGAESCACD